MGRGARVAAAMLAAAGLCGTAGGVAYLVITDHTALAQELNLSRDTYTLTRDSARNRDLLRIIQADQQRLSEQVSHLNCKGVP